MNEVTQVRRIRQILVACLASDPVTRIAAVGVVCICAATLSNQSLAQHREDASGFTFHISGEGEVVGESTQPPTWNVALIDRDSYLAELEAQGVVVPEPRVPTDTRPVRSAAQTTRERREFALRHSDALPPEKLVDMIVALPEVHFAELKRLKRMTAARRADVLDERRLQIQNAQARFTKHAAEHGSQITQSMWFANHLRIRVPAGEVENVLSHEDVVDVHLGLVQGTSDYDGYDGYETRTQTHLQRFVHDGFAGGWGGRVNTPYGGDDIKVAVIEAWYSTGINPDDVHAPFEPNWINDTHPGFKAEDGTSRIRANYVCQNSACVPAPSSSTATHATVVAGIIAGDLTHNQHTDCEDSFGDPCGPLGEERRTGVAHKASILFFRTDTPLDLSSAIFRALVMGADVINLSQSIPNCFPVYGCPALDCLVSQNEGAMNEWIRIATDAGALVVASGGNRNNDTDHNGMLVSRYPEDVSCNLNYPSWRPEVVNVGGIGDVATLLNPLLTYDREPIGTYSARGWVTVGVGGSYSQVNATAQMPSVAIVAPGVVDLHYTEDDTYSDISTHWDFGRPRHGNSFSVPVISGGAALLRQTTGVVDARALKAMILVLGDGAESPMGNASYSAGVSEVYGAGRFKGHQFATLDSPSGAIYNWAWHLEEGQELSLRYPTVLPSQVTNYKWAAYIDQPDLNEVPWVLLWVADACNGGAIIGAMDWFFGIHKFVSLKAPALEAGMCPEVKIYGSSVPEGGLAVYVAGYYHSGDPDEH